VSTSGRPYCSENKKEPESDSSNEDKNNDKLNADISPIQKLKIGCK
jgi:hypothetical protein